MSNSKLVPTVLIVDDEKEVADAYAFRLRDRYDVQTSYGGEEALATIHSDTDVILLDRRMPGVSGDEILQEIRAQNLPCRVIMVTAIDPEFDIFGMPFDDYLCKPLDEEDLFAAIDQQLLISAYELLSDYFELESKLAVLRAQKSPSRLEEHDEYVEFEARAETLRAKLAAFSDDFDEFATAFERIERSSNR